MTRSTLLLTAVCVIAALAAWLMPMPQDMSWWLWRGTAVGLLLVLVLIADAPGDGSGRAVPLVMEPLTLIGLLALLLFSLLPALAASLFYGGPVSLDYTAGPEDIRRYIGFELGRQTTVRAVASPAEWLVLRFVFLTLALTTVMNSLSFSRKSTVQARIPSALVLCLLSCAVPFAARWNGLALVDVLPVEAAPLLPLLPIAATTSLAVLALAARQGSRAALTALATAIAMCLVSFLGFNGKSVGIEIVACILLIAVGLRSRRWRLGLAALALAMPVLLSVGINLSRNGIAVLTAPTSNAAIIAEAKLVFRQADTLYCLAFALDRHGETSSPQGDAAYFLRALVPRVLWPEKPSLSNGGEYAYTYCGWNKEEALSSRHSAAVTLLGEPLIQAGTVGLGLALLTIMAMLCGTSLAIRHGGWVTAATLGTLPWLVDFDQSFAMWLANVVKLGLVSMILAWFLTRRGT